MKIQILDEEIDIRDHSFIYMDLSREYPEEGENLYAINKYYVLTNRLVSSCLSWGRSAKLSIISACGNDLSIPDIGNEWFIYKYSDYEYHIKCIS